MGKPKYYEGQILACRTTGKQFVITTIRYEFNFYTIKPIDELTKKVTPNELIASYWYIGTNKVNKAFIIPKKKSVAATARTVKILYSKKDT